MTKYVFKNAEVGKALRLVAKELGYSDEEFDHQVQYWGHCKTIWIESLEDERLSFDFPTSLLLAVKEFDPNGWNEADVEPPRDSDFKDNSPLLLVEDPSAFPYKAYFDFERKAWFDARENKKIVCARYRTYPSD